jgi:DinB family protein
MEREAALADFEAARAEWESALGKVPDEALAYLKPGDDYALGGLQVHVNWVLVHYGRVLDAMIAGGFAPIGPKDAPGEPEAVNKKARAGLTAAGRRGALAEMANLHQSVVRGVQTIAADDWSRKAPVVYGEGQEPYPTSPEDVIGWLREHYREHVGQSADLIASWRADR